MHSLDALRRRVRVRGQVQGVGFRPFAYRLARDLDLAGWVRNDAEGVEIEVQGDEAGVAEFLRRLRAERPTLARIDSVEVREVAVEADPAAFVIGPSRGGRGSTGIAPDTAVCAECLEELFDPADRRYRYPFLNCTACGPRFTITRRLPYDRPNTSMAPFRQCPACQAEYDRPEDRRFHAQPNACPACGPRLRLVDCDGRVIDADDPVAETGRRLRTGEVVAIKGLGGFHLACNARDAEAVARLRRRKQRDSKPFAVMAANAASLRGLVECGERGRLLLEAPERPIGLLPKSPGCDPALAGVAPGLGALGVMLPHTPLQYLLFHEAAGRPPTSAWLAGPQDPVLVMTSANPGGEPLVIGDEEARVRLGGIADAILLHDREILARCDDSVMIATDKENTSARFVRRARGYTPRAIRLPRAGPSTLAVGGFLKNTVCLTRGDEAFLSQHVGGLDNVATCVAMEEAARRLMDVLEVRPDRVARDLHPDFHSSRFALEFAAEAGLPCVAVQHHHAHIAAVAAEHRIVGPLLGLALDGVGLGSDGRPWGGEMLLLDGSRVDRLGRLRPLPLPGGDRAATEPWRMAAAALHCLGRGAEIEGRFPGPAALAVRRMLEREVNCPATSSAGRWFDAAAGLLDVCRTLSYDAEAAMRLEALAVRHGDSDPVAGGWKVLDDGTLDLLPLLGWVADCRDPGLGAARFHQTMAHAMADWAARACLSRGLGRLALGGGCFVNRVLSRTIRGLLESRGIQVFEAEQVPPNDGGLSLGQAWAAMQAGA